MLLLNAYSIYCQTVVQIKDILANLFYYRTRVRSLGMLVSNSLPNSLTDCCLVNLIDVTLACEDNNSILLRLLLLLMLMLRNVLTTV